MQLTVENVTPAKTGKSLRVKANGEWYGAKKDSGITAGMTIEAEVSDGDYGKWIDKWKALAAQVPAQPPAQQKTGNGTPPAGTPTWLPFASNTVAHAISAGLINEPGQVSMWAKAAKEAFEALT
jgi:hypothetical protein